MKWSCLDIQRNIDRYIEKDVKFGTRRRFKKHLEQCPECSQMMMTDQRVRDLLKEMPLQACPESVVGRIQAATYHSEIQNGIMQKLLVLRGYFTWRRMTLGAAFAAIVLFLWIKPWHMPEPEVSPAYSEEEIEKARMEAKWALGYTSKIVENKNRSVLEEVLFQDIPQTITESFKKALPVFQGGSK